MIEQRFESNVVASKLSLSNVTMGHSGNYSCMIIWGKNNVSATGNLTIARKYMSVKYALRMEKF